MDGKLSLDLQQVPASSVFGALCLSPNTLGSNKVLWILGMCRCSVVVFVQVGEHISSQEVSVQLVHRVLNHIKIPHTQQGIQLVSPGKRPCPT